MMRVTSKGQVTLPKRLRDEAGIPPGSEVDFERDGEAIIVRRAKHAQRGKTRGERVIETLRNSRTVNRELSTDEIMKLLRGDD